MADCYDGCRNCENPICPTIEQDVLVLSTYELIRVPMIISFDGINHREASFTFGDNTEVHFSCSLEYRNQFYVFGGLNQKRQVSHDS